MEGHPRYEDPGAIPAPGRVDSSDAARKRMFLLLDAERRSLAAQVRPSWRLSGRYEDLSLVMILARLDAIGCLSRGQISRAATTRRDMAANPGPGWPTGRSRGALLRGSSSTQILAALRAL